MQITNDSRPSQVRYGRATAIGDLIAGAIMSGVGLVRAAVARIRAWRIAEENRYALAAMSSRELSDIGIDRCDIPSVVAGTFTRGGWMGETPAVFNANLPQASNDTECPSPARRRHRS